MDVNVRLVERGAAWFAAVAVGRKPAIPDAFTAGLIAEAIRAKGNLPEVEEPPKSPERIHRWGGARPNPGPKAGSTMTPQRKRVYDVVVAAGPNGMGPREIAGHIPESNVDSVNQQLLAMGRLGILSRRSAGVWVAGSKGGYAGPQQKRPPVPGGRRIPGRSRKEDRLPAPTGAEADRALAILTAVGLGIRPAAPHPNGHYVHLLMALRSHPDKVYTPSEMAPLGKYAHGTDSGGVYSTVQRFVSAGLLEKVKPGHYKLGKAGK